MAAACLLVLCCLAALCLDAAALPVTGSNAEVTSVVPTLNDQGSHPTGDNVIPLLSQFPGQDPLNAESSDEAGGARQKRTFYCKKCGYGGGYKGGHWGGYRRAYTVVVPVQVVARPVYYRRRPTYNYCDPCARRGYYHPSYGGGGGGGSYAESYSYSRSYSWSGKR